jgi:hypothetical protein
MYLFDAGGEMKTTMKSTAGVLACILAAALVAANASAAIVPTDLNYLGAYRPSQDIDAFGGRGSIAYYDDPVEGDVMYNAADDMVFVDAIPAAKMPGDVGWGNLNVASNLIAKTDVDPGHTNSAGMGLRIRNDGTVGSPDFKVYAPGRNCYVGSADIDLSNAAYKGDAGSDTISGAATHGIPTGFIEAVVGDDSKNDYDTLAMGTRYGLNLKLIAPQNGDGATVPVQSVLSVLAAGAAFWPNGYAATAGEWVQEEGDAWTDAHIVVLERNSDDSNWRISFYDPAKVVANKNNTVAGQADLVDDPSHVIVLEDVENFAHSTGFDSTSSEMMFGMTYDPVNKLLYINEVSTASGGEDGETQHIIHVFSVVPEPATMGLLALGGAAMGLPALRRRRR